MEDEYFFARPYALSSKIYDLDYKEETSISSEYDNEHIWNGLDEVDLLDNDNDNGQEG